MTITELVNKLDMYKIGNTERTWKIKDINKNSTYSNKYITLVRVDSSNKWLPALTMEKQWSIIYKKHQDFSHLSNYNTLVNNYDIKITPVKTGVNAGCYAFRIYGMKKDPDIGIVKDLLDFIFI